MKKRKSRERSYLITGGVLLQTECGNFQYYKGDFFTLFVTRPPLPDVHHAEKKKYLVPNQKHHLLFANDDFIFEIFIEHESICDYELLSNVCDLNKLAPYFSIGVEQAIKAFFNSSLKGPLNDQYLYARVIDLILQLVHHITELRVKPPVNEFMIKFAEKAKRIILEDLSNYDTVEEVAGKVGISEADLQLFFKKCFGTTVGVFSKDERMKFAHHLLETTDEILLSIALAVGYNDPGNFSVAFKNYYGYSPGYIQRKRKQLNSQQIDPISD